MSATVVSWYRPWRRTRPLQPGAEDTNPATTLPLATPAAAHTANATNNDTQHSKEKEKKNHDSLFGPNIGVVSSGPAWATASEKKMFTDELTPDTVTTWVGKSKDTSQPTTTLQALVNLKRPSLRLSPLTPDDHNSAAGSDTNHHQHGLEFEYDCDAPKCGIYVHVLLPKSHPEVFLLPSANSSLSKHLVFDYVTEGGFGKFLKLEEGALLELGRYEHISGLPILPKPSTPNNASTDPAATTDTSATPTDTNPNVPRNSRRRFTHHFRKRSQGRSVSGPALAIVDADPPTAAAAEAKVKDDNSSEGVRVTIRLAALDEQGTELASPNEQVTYLHIVRFGTRPEGEEGEDTRPWVVKVVKREATIGPHTFHLHEIYGLSSSSSSAPTQTPAATAALPTTDHTYPPPPTPTDNPQLAVPVPVAGAEEEPQSECLLCLSSPREVVLLPCRHLVACKDCALNMVEFGAGGNINQQLQTEEPTTTVPPTAASPTADAATGQGAAGATAPSEGAAAVVVTPSVPIPAQRRKRKAKGWFCPVCRQPYTSLLRISTSPPPPPGENKKEADASDAAESPTDVTQEGRRNNGLLGGSFTPAFFRGLSFSRAPPGDIESQAGARRTGS